MRVDDQKKTDDTDLKEQSEENTRILIEMMEEWGLADDPEEDELSSNAADLMRMHIAKLRINTDVN